MFLEFSEVFRLVLGTFLWFTGIFKSVLRDSTVVLVGFRRVSGDFRGKRDKEI